VNIPSTGTSRVATLDVEPHCEPVADFESTKVLRRTPIVEDHVNADKKRADAIGGLSENMAVVEQGAPRPKRGAPAGR